MLTVTVIVTMTDVVTVIMSQTETLGLSIHTGLEHTYGDGRPCLSRVSAVEGSPGAVYEQSVHAPGVSRYLRPVFAL